MRSSQRADQNEVTDATIAQLTYPTVLWARRSKNGNLVWGEFLAERGVCWVLAQSSPVDVEFRVDKVPEFTWVEMGLDALLRSAASTSGKGKDGRELPCLGVLIDFQRRVYVR